MFARGSAGILIAPPIAAALFFYLGVWPLGFVMLIFWAILLVFFRDPERTVGRGIVSAADGTVDWVRVKGNWLVISVFMNLNNVHVNRAPIGGKVIKVARRSGGMWPAFLKRSSRNTKATIILETNIGTVKVEQIAGVFAWRVCPYVRHGHIVRRGQRIGMIRFGSRVNVWLPRAAVRCKVKTGDKTFGGITTIAEVL